MVTGNEHIHIRETPIAQKASFSEAVTVAGDQYITFLRIKQDTQAVFIVISRQWGCKNTDFGIPSIQNHILPGIQSLLCRQRKVRIHRRQDQKFRVNPGKQIFRTACMIPVVMGQNQSVQMGNPLTQQGFRCPIRSCCSLPPITPSRPIPTV